MNSLDLRPVVGQTDPQQCTAEEMVVDFEDADTDGSGEVTPVELQAWTGAAEWSSDHIELGIFADADGKTSSDCRSSCATMA